MKDRILKKKYILRLVIYFIAFIQISCGITKDTDCIKQKQSQARCARYFALFCSGNQSRPECNGSLNSVLTIGIFCNVGAACKQNTDDVVSEEIQSEKKIENQ